MKNLIRTILKETVDNRIVDVLIKLNLNDYKKIKEFLEEAGYDSKEINEIYYSYFKSISGLELTPMNWMNYYFSPDKLEVVKDDEYKNSIFFKKDGKVVMEENKKSRYFWFSYKEIWSFFESFFGMEYEQMREVLRYWLEETLKLKGYTPKSTNGYRW